MNWSGRAKATDCKVLRAHIRLAYKLGLLTYGAGVRTVADEAGIPARTVADAHKRLIKLGWLDVVCLAEGRDANVWRLQVGRPGKSRDANFNNPHTQILTRGRKARSVRLVEETVTEQPITSPLALNAPTESQLQALMAIHAGPLTAAGRHVAYVGKPGATPSNVTENRGGSEELAADAFRSDGGLGPHTQNVWLNLSREMPRPTWKVAGLSGIKPGSALYHLHKLLSRGLAISDRRGWWRAAGDLDKVAVELGVAGEGARQKMRNHSRKAPGYDRLGARGPPGAPASPARYRIPGRGFRAAKTSVHAYRRAAFVLPPTQLRLSFHCSCCRLSAGVLLEEMPRRLPTQRRGRPDTG